MKTNDATDASFKKGYGGLCGRIKFTFSTDKFNAPADPKIKDNFLRDSSSLRFPS